MPLIAGRFTATLLAVLFVTSASATKLSEFDEMDNARRESLLNDRARIIHHWLSVNEPQTARCFYESTMVGSSGGAVSPAARDLLDRIESIKKRKRRHTILGVLMLEWIRTELCAVPS